MYTTSNAIPANYIANSTINENGVLSYTPVSSPAVLTSVLNSTQTPSITPLPTVPKRPASIPQTVHISPVTSSTATTYGIQYSSSYTPETSDSILLNNNNNNNIIYHSQPTTNLTHRKNN